MTEAVEKLTLDTNVIRELGDQRIRHAVVETLLDLNDRQSVDVAV